MSVQRQELHSGRRIPRWVSGVLHVRGKWNSVCQHRVSNRLWFGRLGSQRELWSPFTPLAHSKKQVYNLFNLSAYNRSKNCCTICLTRKKNVRKRWTMSHYINLIISFDVFFWNAHVYFYFYQSKTIICFKVPSPHKKKSLSFS